MFWPTFKAVGAAYWLLIKLFPTVFGLYCLIFVFSLPGLTWIEFPDGKFAWTAPVSQGLIYAQAPFVFMLGDFVAGLFYSLFLMIVYWSCFAFLIYKGLRLLAKPVDAPFIFAKGLVVAMPMLAFFQLWIYGLERLFPTTVTTDGLVAATVTGILSLFLFFLWPILALSLPQALSGRSASVHRAIYQARPFFTQLSLFWLMYACFPVALGIGIYFGSYWLAYLNQGVGDPIWLQHWYWFWGHPATLWGLIEPWLPYWIAPGMVVTFNAVTSAWERPRA